MEIIPYLCTTKFNDIINNKNVEIMSRRRFEYLKQLESWDLIQQTEIENKFKRTVFLDEVTKQLWFELNVTDNKKLYYMFYKYTSKTNEYRYLVRLEQYKKIKNTHNDWHLNMCVNSDIYDNLSELLNSTWCQVSIKKTDR